ncbi:enoyl-CoA hydratase/isomerase family protein [Cumulibacter manganitolerans]|uniref:enoyl-CoA hydratase/isomerase family protein n=1 Tax=Cumulibacter manganitolerans TaxID=1884992 RepID=UPI001295D8AC|nr:enoyl-CoA hydratase/isomerase family protein [Cumulibacter manganitolerans]
MTKPQVLAVRNGPVAEITLNRPERRNALTAGLVTELHAEVGSANRADEVGAILIHGAGGSLCSGLDLKDPGVAEIAPAWQSFHRSIAAMHTPLVIALEGAAINAGAALTFAGDIVIAGRSAFLEVMEARIGMMPPVNLAWLLYRHSVALGSRLALTCERVTGPDLERLGIAQRVVEDDAVLNAARAMARQIADYPKQSGAGVLGMLYRGSTAQGRSFDDLLDALNGPVVNDSGE